MGISIDLGRRRSEATEQVRRRTRLRLGSERRREREREKESKSANRTEFSALLCLLACVSDWIFLGMDNATPSPHQIWLYPPPHQLSIPLRLRQPPKHHHGSMTKHTIHPSTQLRMGKNASLRHYPSVNFHCKPMLESFDAVSRYPGLEINASQPPELCGQAAREMDIK
jgi:hypothetical protein